MGGAIRPPTAVPVLKSTRGMVLSFIPGCLSLGADLAMSSRYALKAKPLRGGLRPALTARAVMASLRLREWLRG
jgi:hypothetical protein